ncbi:hypothetical protein [Pseudomonas sp. EA_35y_Pfl2_R5]|uniref:hypothetical protein n=1 Tax=Pseudomonas sp. EA_35y_Pfl2_R5 TaxID=3088690 RepID=UPI0030DC2E6E
MEFIQSIGFFKGKLKITVGSDDVLTLSQVKFLNKVENKFLLDNIDPQYDVYKNFSIGAFTTSTISLVLAILTTWYGSTYFQPPDDGPYLLTSGLLFMSFFFFGVNAYKSKISVVCFNGHNGQRLFSILGNKPNSEKVTMFCNEIKNRIERIKYNGEISAERMAGILEKHVEFLCEHQVLSSEEKAQAIARINTRKKPTVVKLHESKSV